MHGKYQDYMGATVWDVLRAGRFYLVRVYNDAGWRTHKPNRQVWQRAAAARFPVPSESDGRQGRPVIWPAKSVQHRQTTVKPECPRQAATTRRAQAPT